MLNVYTGKLRFEPYATNTIITVVVPDSIATNHPCLVYWQWAVTNSGQKNQNVAYNGQFTALASPTVEIRGPSASDPFYWFKWDFVANSLQLMNKADVACGLPVELTLVYPVSFLFAGRIWVVVTDLEGSMRIERQPYIGIRYTDVGWDAFFGAAEILLVGESRHMPVY